ncbi:MAG: EAL domain-containing protein [Frankiales bacterium]|nr:MAG: EAL domain-containing protein [Frankiales bacterium]
MPRNHWSTQQLTELLTAVVDLPDRATIVQRSLEHMAESLECEVAALVDDGIVLHSLGYPAGATPVALLVDVAEGRATTLECEGVGDCTVALAECAGVGGGSVLLARSESLPFVQEERALLRGMAQVLSLALQGRRLVDEERGHRRLSDAHAADNAKLLASLRERQELLERLSRIQRSISSRQPLNDVLDAIVAGAAELLGEDIVGLRLVDTVDPRYMLMVSSIGVPEELALATARQPVGQGVGGRAIVENTLVLTSHYPSVEQPLPGFAADGILAAMACPVRQGGEAVGSLVVATRRPHRTYSATEQEALTAFAEHVSLALNDAQSVQALHRAVDEATRQSLHDSLTGLPNRALFLDRLAHAGERSARQDGAPYTLLFIDVDDFKVVNDSLGHLVGDRLLTAVAERVQASLRTQDTVARLGGDEFAVLLEDSDVPDATAAAERVLEALAGPFDLPGRQTVHVSASIGLVTTRGSRDQAEELLRDADVAMYRAKAEGKHRYVVFEPAMRDRLQRRTELESELRRAVAEEQFTVHYQPVLDARTGTVMSTEALLRWEHPRRGLVSPAEFVPLAEDTGLIVAMGRFVLREACRQTAEWRGSPALADLTVSVNLSPRQLQEPGLLEDVRQALADSGLPPCALVLEITENLLVRDVEQAAHRLDSLKSLGVRLAVDDFGTGYSSLSYLSRLPVDILKVDKAFVAGIAREESAGKLAWAVLALAESLGLETVAEGVETPEQAEALIAQGCTRLQGFLFSRPVPASVLPGTAAALRDRLSMAASARRVVPGMRTPEREIALPT